MSDRGLPEHPPTPGPRRRTLAVAAVALLTVALLTVTSCSGQSESTNAVGRPTTTTDAPSSGASSTVAPSTGAGTSDATDSGSPPVTDANGVPTLPPETLEELAENSVGDPDPALPPNVVPTVFKPGQLASLGNVQFIVDTVVGPTKAPTSDTPLTLELRLRNASRDDVSVDPGAFRLYYVSGSSSTATSSGGDAFGKDIGPDSWAEGALAFEVPAGERPIMVVFDSASLGDRVLSGAVVVGD